MADLIFYANPMSRGRIARWTLEEAGQPYDTEIVGFGPQMKTPAYRAVNPMGKVPALVHRGQVTSSEPMTVLLCGSRQTHTGPSMRSGGGHIIRAQIRRPAR
jgi:glutathione S-transferase